MATKPWLSTYKKSTPTALLFFQYPVGKNWKSSKKVWYENRPLGINKLGKMMADISKAAGLSMVYTNHSVTAKAITVWSNAGIPNRHIKTISGHRNEQSLVHYNARPSTSQLRNCSDVLSRSLIPGHPVYTDQSNTLQPSIDNHTSLANVAVTSTKAQSFSMAGSMFSSCSIENVQIVIKSSDDR